MSEIWCRGVWPPILDAMAAVKQHSTAGIEEVSGIAWPEWVAHLDEAGAESLTHAEIAKLTYQKMPDTVHNRGWWAQGAAIAYEHQKGLRIPGQASDGKFSASASKTVSGDKDAALARWLEVVSGREDFGDVPLEGESRTSSTPKWRYWRATLADGTRVEVTISEKSSDKSTVAVQHSKLESEAEIPGWKTVWKDVLSQL